MTTQSLVRSAAVIYADNFTSRKTETIKKKFIEAVFVSNGNKTLMVEEIADVLQTDMELTFTDPEIEAIVKDEEVFVLQQVDKNKAHDKYNLTGKRYLLLSSNSEKNIDECIKQYLVEKESDRAKSEKLRSLLEKYLYSMMNSNIEAFNQVLGGKIDSNDDDNKNGRVNPDEFTDDEINEINDFLSWKNSAKDKELFKMISCCIEYAIVANNSNENTLLRSLRNKTLYIDNAFIYRALGINGETRRKRTLSFIQKCNECGQKIKITKFSREEFYCTVDYNIQQLNRTTPFGRIHPSLFQRYTHGETIYQFYHRWRAERLSYGFNSFKTYIISEYNNLVRSYGIEEDFRPPFDDSKEIPEVQKYSDEIKFIKRHGNKAQHDTDALNMYWVEKARNGVDGKLIDTKYYFITPDQKLQLWDSHHSTNQPITLLPSQWLALLLKYTSRSNDDYISFVSFLRLSRNEPDVTADDLQEILAGISEITEDIKQQSDYLDVYMEGEWQQIRNAGGTALRDDARRFAKDKQEEYFKKELEKKSQEMAKELDKQNSLNKEQLERLEASYKEQLFQQEIKGERERLKLKLEFTKQTLNATQRQLVDAAQKKQDADNKVAKAVKMKKSFSIIGLILAVGCWLAAIFYFGWDKMEVFTYVLTVIIALSSVLYLIIYEKAFSLDKTIEKVRKRNERKIYSKYGVSDSLIADCTQELDALKREIASIEKKLTMLSSVN